MPAIYLLFKTQCNPILQSLYIITWAVGRLENVQAYIKSVKIETQYQHSYELLFIPSLIGSVSTRAYTITHAAQAVVWPM